MIAAMRRRVTPFKGGREKQRMLIDKNLNHERCGPAIRSTRELS